MHQHKSGMELGQEHVRKVEQREFPLLTHGAFCSHHPSPSVHYHCLLHPDGTLLLSHLSPLAPEEEKEKQSELCFSQRAL